MKKTLMVLGLFVIVGCGSKEVAAVKQEVAPVGKTEVVEMQLIKGEEPRGDMNNEEYLLVLYNAAFEFDLHENVGDKLETYKELANSFGVNYTDLIDVRIGLINSYDDNYTAPENEAYDTLDGNRYHITKFTRLLYGEFQDWIYEEVHKIKNGESDLKKMSLKELSAKYDGVAAVLEEWTYDFNDKPEEDMLREVMDEIVYTNYYDNKCTLKTDDRNTAKVLVESSVKVFGDKALEFKSVRNLLQLDFMRYNYGIHGRSGKDMSNDREGVLPLEKVEQIEGIYYNTPKLDRERRKF